MTETVTLRAHIAQIFAVGLHVQGYPRHDPNPRVCKLGELLRIIGQQANAAYLEILQNRHRSFVAAMVSLETQLQVRPNRIEPGILQIISAELVHQADAASLSSVEETLTVNMLPHQRGHT
jgi:hypothetical protein